MESAKKLRLDSKDALFQAVSKYAFSAFLYHYDMLTLNGEIQIRLYYWPKLYWKYFWLKFEFWSHFSSIQTAIPK